MNNTNKTVLIVISGILLLGGFIFLASRNEGNVDQTDEGANPISKRDEQEKKRERKKDPLPQFTLKDYDGNEVSSTDFAGKPMVVNSWAVWCPFCVDELIDFGRLQEELGDEVVVIAIDRAEPLEKQKKFTDELGVTDEMLFLLDPSDSFYRSIGGFTMPETLFVDKDGVIQLHKRGPMDLEEMRKNAQLIL